MVVYKVGGDEGGCVDVGGGGGGWQVIIMGQMLSHRPSGHQWPEVTGGHSADYIDLYRGFCQRYKSMGVPIIHG